MKARLAVLSLVATAACASTPSVSRSAVSLGSAGPAQSSFDAHSVGADNPAELSSTERALALRIARTEAWTSQPSSPGLSPPGADPNTWPSNVDQVSVIATTHPAAMQFVGGGTANYWTSLRVLVIRLFGRFSWVTSGPPGHSDNAIGTVATIVVNATTGQVTDSGLEDDQNPELPAASILYTRTPETASSRGSPPDAESSPTEGLAQPASVQPTTSAGTVLLTNAQANFAPVIVVPLGTTILVRLTFPSQNPVDPPYSDDTAVLELQSGPSSPSTNIDAKFRVIGQGQARIIAEVPCIGTGCAAAAYGFTIQVPSG